MARYYTYLNRRISKCDGCGDDIKHMDEVYSNSTGVYHKDCDYIGMEREDLELTIDLKLMMESDVQ